MVRPEVRAVRRRIALVIGVAALASCGNGASDEASPSPTSGSVAPGETVVATGSELAGVAFDVRRDPG